MSLDVLTLESLDKLFHWSKTHPGDSAIAHSFESLEEELSLQYVPLAYSLEPNFEGLVIPGKEKNEDLESDKVNVSVVYAGLSGLSPAQATDERLWATLALKHLSEYTLARWPLPSEESKISNHITSHWLCKSGVRSRARDNSISRLWWMGRIVHLMDGWQSEEVVSILFNNSDYRASIVERSSSSSSPAVVSAILSITKEAFANGIAFKRSSFREFMKEVNFLAGRANLAAIPEIDLINLLRPVYQKCYSEPVKETPPKRGMLDKLIGR